MKSTSRCTRSSPTRRPRNACCVRDPPDLTEIRDIIDDIVVEDRRAGEVIQRLRKWLRKEHVDHVPLALNDVVLDALHLVRADLLHRGVDVQLELAGKLPHVEGDRIQLQQVLLNFVMNGCDAMERTARAALAADPHLCGEDGVRATGSDRSRPSASRLRSRR